MSRRLSGQRKPLGLLNTGRRSKRRSWTVEKLEDRMVFSASPITLNLQTVSFGNDSAEGAAMTWLREVEWAAVQAAAASNLPAPDYILMSLPSDPLFEDQWHLLNTGQEVGNPDLQSLFGVAGEDINVIPAWNLGYTGEGVTVAVIDSGVQFTHPDLIANISPTLRYNANNGTSNASPTLTDLDAGHGTSVAGIIGAVADNGIGGSGVAPGVTIVPIKLDFGPNSDPEQFFNAFQYALQHDIDITNNSWGPNHEFNRSAISLTPAEAQVLREAAIFGRDGLGMINVFSSGNNSGPAFNNQAFVQYGNYDSSSYNAWANSRYVITVTGVDHDGTYGNADGTFTSYPTVGPNVLVAAPTGSNGRIAVANDNGYGSGIWTADLVGDFGFNAAPLPNGFDADNDPLDDPNYTSRFNGTSASAPVVTGVIALMLDANPNLTYRDVQEILLRSARQNAELDTPTSGALAAARSTWQTNQVGPFRDPDPWDNHLLYPLPVQENPSEAIGNPLADPSLEGFAAFGGVNELAPSAGDFERQYSSRYESQPAMYTNGAGYTVSQGFGVYAEQTGYAHGIVDAELAVLLARQWHTLGQNSNPNTEKTFTSSVVSWGTGGLNLPAAEKTANDHGAWIVPGGIGGRSGFIGYWDEFYQEVTIDDATGIPDPTTGPFSGDNPPVNTRGLSYIDFYVPPPQQINVEWVEVKLDIRGEAENLDYLRIMLTSPEGTQSEFMNYYIDPGIGTPWQTQPISAPGETADSIWRIDPAGSIGTSTEFVWTFSTNRSWGETTNAAVVIDPVTGEPAVAKDFTGQPVSTIFRNWELHIENWGTADMSLPAVEIVWHGKPIDGGVLDPNYGSQGVASAQRVQGFVGIDTNGDELFNYSRTVQTVTDTDADPTTTRLLDVTRALDYVDNNNNGYYDSGDVANQEPFAENIIVDAYRAWDGVAESTPVARFLTGADGNYYFDLNVQGDLARTTTVGDTRFGQTLTYQIKVTDPLNRAQLEDVDTPAMLTSNPLYSYLPHYKQEWTITPDWFFAPDRDNPLTSTNDPGEIFFDPSTGAPVPFTAEGAILAAPMAVKNINFLLKEDAPVDQFDVTGNVFADVNGNGTYDGDDATLPNATVYWDKNRNGVYDAGETQALTDANGQYTITLDLSTLPPPTPAGAATYQVGVIMPTTEWQFTDPGLDGVETVFAGPGSPAQIVDFFLLPPDGAFPDGGDGEGTIAGVVYNDLNGNGTRDAGENGLANFRVFIDANEDGSWDSASEASVVTGSNGSYLFTEVTPGVVRIDIVIPDEGTAAAAWTITKPTAGYRDVNLGPGGSVTAVLFGLDNLADNDWGDLPNTFGTTAAANGPRHFAIPGFQLGISIDGEVNGIPTPGATGEGTVGDDDDGVTIASNGGVLVDGANTLHVVVAGVGGLLTGWMDFNADGHFDESERLQWSLNGTSLGGEADLNPGAYDLQINIPQGAIDGPIAARFRWGEQGLSFLGAAQIGEVEDYFFGLNYIYGDYNRNGTVDQADFNVWRKQNGTSVAPYTGADGDGDGLVNQADYEIWRAHFGQSLPAPAAGALLAGNSLVGSAAALASDGSMVGSTSIAPAVAALLFDGGPVQSAPATGSVVASSTVVLAARTADPLLLDLALSDLGNGAADSSVELLYETSDNDNANANDLALAAVLSGDDDWWNAI